MAAAAIPAAVAGTEAVRLARRRAFAPSSKASTVRGDCRSVAHHQWGHGRLPSMALLVPRDLLLGPEKHRQVVVVHAQPGSSSSRAAVRIGAIDWSIVGWLWLMAPPPRAAGSSPGSLPIPASGGRSITAADLVAPRPCPPLHGVHGVVVELQLLRQPPAQALPLLRAQGMVFVGAVHAWDGVCGCCACQSQGHIPGWRGMVLCTPGVGLPGGGGCASPGRGEVAPAGCECVRSRVSAFVRCGHVRSAAARAAATHLHAALHRLGAEATGLQQRPLADVVCAATSGRGGGGGMTHPRGGALRVRVAAATTSHDKLHSLHHRALTIELRGGAGLGCRRRAAGRRAARGPCGVHALACQCAGADRRPCGPGQRIGGRVC